MSAGKADIISRLQKDILFQQFKPAAQGVGVNQVDLGAINAAFPIQCFPKAAVHEFCCADTVNQPATSGFISAVLSMLMQNKEATAWISNSANIYPPALAGFGIDASSIIFIHLRREKDILWTIEEMLKCDAFAAVVGETTSLDFTASRRLQLAVEQSKVTGFIIRHNYRKPEPTACVSRWQITHASSVAEDGMPGIGFPRWNVELLKVRNGTPGRWLIEWNAGRLRNVPAMKAIVPEQYEQIA